MIPFQQYLKAVTYGHDWLFDSGGKYASFNWSTIFVADSFSLFVKEPCTVRMMLSTTSLSYRFPNATALWLTQPPIAWSHGPECAL